MSEEVRLALKLERYREARRTIGAVLKDTRKSVELTKEQKRDKIASLNASRQELREREKAIQGRIGLEKRAGRLAGRRFDDGLTGLGQGASRAGALLGLANQGGQFLSGLGSGEFTVAQGLGALSATLGAINPAVGAIGATVTALITPVIDALKADMERRLATFEAEQRRLTDQALQTTSDRLKQDPFFANREARRQAAEQVRQDAAYAAQGLTPAGRGEFTF